MLNGITRLLSRTFIVACAAGISLLAAASPAGASPDRDRGHNHGRNDRIIIRGSVNIGGGTCTTAPLRQRVIVHGDSCGCNDCCVKRDYARGYNRGEAAGANQGFRDGINGKASCADVRDDLCHESRQFQAGYAAAFGKTYRYSYERGCMERAQACRPVHGPRCP